MFHLQEHELNLQALCPESLALNLRPASRMFLVPTLAFVKAMSPRLVPAAGGTLLDIVTQLEHVGKVGGWTFVLNSQNIV
jgi:hypothetical protein